VRLVDPDTPRTREERAAEHADRDERKRAGAG